MCMISCMYCVALSMYWIEYAGSIFIDWNITRIYETVTQSKLAHIYIRLVLTDILSQLLYNMLTVLYFFCIFCLKTFNNVITEKNVFYSLFDCFLESVGATFSWSDVLIKLCHGSNEESQLYVDQKQFQTIIWDNDYFIFTIVTIYYLIDYWFS